jgi:signal transduction histidine kinase
VNASHLILPSHYDYTLVAASVLIAVAGSYAAFNLAGRVTAAVGWPRLYWLLGGAIATGIGTWSMHYVGMLAFRLPVPVEYDWPTALASLAAAIFSYVVALQVVSRHRMGSVRALAGGVFMGGGIAALHYTAMASMRLPAERHYSPLLVALSVLVAMAGSVLALLLTFFFRHEPPGPKLRRAGGAILMGITIASMHYIAMAASTFTPSQTAPDLSHAVSTTAVGVPAMVIVPLMVLIIAVLTSMVDRLQQSFEQLQALGTRLQTAREEERRRIAREIHDDLGHVLTAIKIALSSLLLELPEQHRPSKRAESIVKLIDEAISSVRRIATELRPAILDDLGLVAAIEWAAEEFETRIGTKCRLNLSAVPMNIDREHTTAVFRIFQEALTNVARHSGATVVDVRLAVDNGELTLELHDNGVGADDERLSTSQSLGVIGMRERAVLLGGEFSIRAEPAKGTSVKVRIPLDHSDNSRL